MAGGLRRGGSICTRRYLRVGHFVVWRDQEPAWLLLALGLLLLVTRSRLRQDTGTGGAVDGNPHP
jgi:hypothetical protein